MGSSASSSHGAANKSRAGCHQLNTAMPARPGGCCCYPAPCLPALPLPTCGWVDLFHPEAQRVEDAANGHGAGWPRQHNIPGTEEPRMGRATGVSTAVLDAGQDRAGRPRHTAIHCNRVPEAATGVAMQPRGRPSPQAPAPTARGSRLACAVLRHDRQRQRGLLLKLFCLRQVHSHAHMLQHLCREKGAPAER